MDCDIRSRRVLVTGATGLIGTALCRQLRQCGIEVVELGRRPRTGGFAWDADSGAPPPAEAFAGVTAVIHLAGSPIARRWSHEARRSIRDSRVNGTRALAEALAALPATNRPEVLVSMSGVAVYGRVRAEALLGENAAIAPAGDSFLADVARDWEAATAPASAAGIRTVHLRTGVVLAKHGGALAKLLPGFRLFLGGPVGPGTQRMPWITLHDLASLIFFALRTRTIQGPLNAVAPHAVTNADFAAALGAVLNRPAKLPVPTWALRIVFGQMAEETLLADLSPFPAKAMEAGFQFTHNRIKDALGALLGPSVAPASKTKAGA